MNIIQSYYMLETSVKHDPCLYNSSYLSYLSLKEQFGKVTMYCNEIAYDNIFKYIPYDNIIFIDPNKDFKDIDINIYWFISKFSALQKTNVPSIHIDNDVIIFRDVLSNFNNPYYDMVLQQVEQGSIMDVYMDAINRYNTKVSCRFPISYKNRRSVNVGVVGFKDKKLENLYIETVFKNIDYFNRNGIHEGSLVFIAEQMTLSEMILQNNYKPYYILDENNYIEDAQRKGYVHLWASFKNNPIISTMIKTKIKTNYPLHYDNIKKYENLKL